MTVPVQVRSARPKSTNPADFVTPTSREVEWRFTPLAKVSQLVDGALDGAPFEYQLESTGVVTVDWISKSDARVGKAGMPEDKAAANAWTAVDKVLLIEVPADEKTEVTLTRSQLGAQPAAAHVVIHVAPFSSARIVLNNTGDAQLAENVEIVLDESAQLDLVSVQDWNPGAIHVASHFARIEKHATLTHSLVSIGGEVVRVNPSAHLAGEGATAHLNGLYFARSGQHLEQQVYVNHDAPQTVSRVNYKGALHGSGARSVWIGDVLIGPQGSGTDSYEQNRNLVLTDGTRSDSIPNLEIETGDIVGAGHASATGRFDEEQLFYLQSRGITEDEARRLVLTGFFHEILQQVGIESLTSRIDQALETALDAAQHSTADSAPIEAPEAK